MKLPIAPIATPFDPARPAAGSSAAKLTLVSLLALSLTACGGGGGSSDATTTPAPTPAPAPTPTPAPAPAPSPAPVVVAPTITVQPADQTVAAGAAASYSVTAGGTTPTYQWQSSTDGTTWTNVAGATAATLTLNGTGSGLAAADSGKKLRVVVSNSAGTVTSSSAQLTVLTPVTTGAPAIASQPTDVSVTAPSAVAFTVNVTGSPAPTIQWQKSVDGGTTFSNIAGATTATYTIGATLVSDNASQYRAVVTNSVGTTTSRAATLNVSAATVAAAIVSQPAAASVTAPASATFSVVASGNPTPTYQWQLSTDAGATFASITGATASTYSTPATSVAASGQQYRVVVTSGSSSVTSQAVTLTVAAPATVVGSASACTSTQAYTTGNTATVVYSSVSPSGTSTTTSTTVVNGPATFHGQTATEVQTTSNIVPPAGSSSGTINSVTKAYVAYTSSSALLTQYGLHRTTTFPTTGGNEVIDDDGVYSPAAVDARYQSNPGGTTSVTVHQTVTTTVAAPFGSGVPSTSAPTDTTTSVTFAGLESLTVPASSTPYQTCKFVETDSNNQQTYIWQLLNSGVVIQTTTGTLSSKAQSIRINGVAY